MHKKFTSFAISQNCATILNFIDSHRNFRKLTKIFLFLFLSFFFSCPTLVASYTISAALGDCNEGGAASCSFASASASIGARTDVGTGGGEHGAASASVGAEGGELGVGPSDGGPDGSDKVMTEEVLAAREDMDIEAPISKEQKEM